jgi:thiol:disulfide interchange protein
MIRGWLLALVGAMLMISSLPAAAQRPAGVKIREDLYIASSYDPARDPEADLKLAVAKAAETHRNVLIDVGGEWCIWCHILDDYLARNRNVGDAFAKSFVIVKINWDPKNENETFLSRYPKVDGYPHFIVLDSTGKHLKSQDTSELERGDSYNSKKMLDFAKRWLPVSPR